MKLISHRGNVNGPNLEKENSLSYIDAALKLKYDVEIDLRYKNEQFFLGHDTPQYVVSIDWLIERKNNLWIHCKDLQSLQIIANISTDFNYFWHQEDDFTLTSKKYIWTYPGKSYGPNSVIVLPEKNDLLKFYHNDKIVDVKEYNCYAICSDYVGRMI